MANAARGGNVGPRARFTRCGAIAVPEGRLGSEMRVWATLTEHLAHSRASSLLPKDGGISFTNRWVLKITYLSKASYTSHIKSNVSTSSSSIPKDLPLLPVTELGVSLNGLIFNKHFRADAHFFSLQGYL